MSTAGECRQHAQECLQLACTAVDFYARDALVELAADFQKMAEGRGQPAIKADEDASH